MKTYTIREDLKELKRCYKYANILYINGVIDGKTHSNIFKEIKTIYDELEKIENEKITGNTLTYAK